MSTRAEKTLPAPNYRAVCQCDHCRELAHVSAGLWAAYGMPRPHTREADELIAAARETKARAEASRVRECPNGGPHHGA